MGANSPGGFESVFGEGALLAIDLGLRTGIACFGKDARLRWFQSRHFASMEPLKRGIVALLDATPDCTAMVIEGGGALAKPWLQRAGRRGIPVRLIDAGYWRERLLHSRQRRGGEMAKRHASALARAVIGWSGLCQPKVLRHDAAEAILAGYCLLAGSGRFAGLPLPVLGGRAT